MLGVTQLGAQPLVVRRFIAASHPSQPWSRNGCPMNRATTIDAPSKVRSEQRSLFTTKRDVQAHIFRRERRSPFHSLNVNPSNLR